MIERKGEAHVPSKDLAWGAEKRLTRRLFRNMSQAKIAGEEAYIRGMSDLTREVAQLLSADVAREFLSGSDKTYDILMGVFKENMSQPEKPHNTGRNRGISLKEARVLIRAYSLDNSDLTLRQIAEVEGLRKAAEVAQVVKRARREIADKVSPRNAWED